MQKDQAILRTMRIEDLPGARRLWQQTQGIAIREYDDSLESTLRFLRRNPNTSLVIEYQGEIVGTLLCGNDGRRGFLYHFAVREDLRHHGLGQRLLDCAYQELKKCGIAKAGLVALTSNAAGITYWKKQGWIRREDLYYFDLPLIQQAK